MSPTAISFGVAFVLAPAGIAVAGLGYVAFMKVREVFKARRIRKALKAEAKEIKKEHHEDPIMMGLAAQIESDMFSFREEKTDITVYDSLAKKRKRKPRRRGKGKAQRKVGATKKPRE